MNKNISVWALFRFVVLFGAAIVAGLFLVNTPRKADNVGASDGLDKPNIEIVLQKMRPLSRNFAAPYLCARFAQGDGDWAAASSYMQWAVQANPDDAQLAHHAMILAMGSGFIDQAAKMARKTLQLTDGDDYPDISPLPYIVLIGEALINGNSDEAKDIQSKMIAVYGDKDFKFLDDLSKETFSNEMMSLAMRFLEKGQYDVARIFAQIALAVDQDLRPLRAAIGEIHQIDGNYVQSLKYFESVGSPRDEVYVNSHQSAAEILVDLDKNDEAILELKSLADGAKGLEAAQIFLQIGEIYRSQEEYKKAIAEYNQAMDELPEDVDKNNSAKAMIYFVRAMAFDGGGDWASAQEDLLKAIEMSPNNADMLNYLGYSWIDKGQRLDDAVELLARALKISPDSYYIVDSMGWAQYRLGNFDDAVVLLERSAELAPYDDAVSDHLGDAYWMAGRKAEARFQWQRAINYSEDKTLISKAEGKLIAGLDAGGQDL